MDVSISPLPGWYPIIINTLGAKNHFNDGRTEL